MTYTDNAAAAYSFIEAIKKISSKPENIENLRSYLSSHFDVWLNRYANTPLDLAIEMQSFADMTF